MSADDRQSFGSSAASVKFETLCPLKASLRRELDGAGPFVTQTGGAFGTEYFNERKKILDIDYLASSGG